MANTLYGIKSCDTVRKARKWLETNQVDYQFHDLREDGIDKQTIDVWLTRLQWQELFNKRSTTFRQLDATDKDNLDQQSAIQLMLAHPTLIKRPVLTTDERILVGFKQENYQAELGE